MAAMMEEEVVVDLGSLPLALNIFIGLLIAVEGVAQQASLINVAKDNLVSGLGINSFALVAFYLKSD